MDDPLRRAQKMADNCLCCHIGYISNSSKGIFETIVDGTQDREGISLTPIPIDTFKENTFIIFAKMAKESLK